MSESDEVRMSQPVHSLTLASRVTASLCLPRGSLSWALGSPSDKRLRLSLRTVHERRAWSEAADPRLRACGEKV